MVEETKEPDLLSEHLRWYIERANEEDSGEDPEASSVVEKLIQTTTSSLEGFAPAAANELIKFWHQNPINWRWAVDDFYSRSCVSQIPDIVRRFLKLTPVLVGRVPSSEVSIYLREATQCFLHGFFQGSVALSRAALEAGINELLLRQLGAVPSVELVEKLRQLERFRLLDPQTSNDAHLVRKAAGVVLHKSPAPEKLAFEALIKARAVLMRMYKA
jgi:hypothetical protein